MTNAIHLESLSIVGDLRKGRPNLGNLMSVAVYRLTLYSIKSVLDIRCGRDTANEIIYDAGRLAGKTVYQNLMRDINNTRELIEAIKSVFSRAKIGLISVEKADEKNGVFVMNLREDLDCSGLPEDGETKCNFDEGLISGILSTHFKREFETKEIRCWGMGEKFCSFRSVRLG